MKTGSWIFDGTGFRPGDGLPFSDRGFRYGMHLFETLAVRRGKPAFVDAHLTLLRAGCEREKFVVDAALWTALAEFLRGGGEGDGDGILRVHVTAGDGAPADPPARARVIVRFDSVPLPLDIRPSGLDIGIIGDAPGLHPSGLKSGNYWPRITALRHARTNGFDEAMMFNPQGECSGACMANIFFSPDGNTLFSPPQSSGARPGVVRRWMLENGFAEECALHKTDLPDIRHLLLTNSSIGPAPVASLDRRPLASLPSLARIRTRYLADLEHGADM